MYISLTISLVTQKVHKNIEETLVEASQPFSCLLEGIWHHSGDEVIHIRIVSDQFSAVAIQLGALALNRIDKEGLRYRIVVEDLFGGFYCLVGRLTLASQDPNDFWNGKSNTIMETCINCVSNGWQVITLGEFLMFWAGFLVYLLKWAKVVTLVQL